MRFHSETLKPTIETIDNISSSYSAVQAPNLEEFKQTLFNDDEFIAHLVEHGNVEGNLKAYLLTRSEDLQQLKVQGDLLRDSAVQAPSY